MNLSNEYTVYTMTFQVKHFGPLLESKVSFLLFPPIWILFNTWTYTSNIFYFKWVFLNKTTRFALLFLWIISIYSNSHIFLSMLPPLWYYLPHTKEHTFCTMLHITQQTLSQTLTIGLQNGMPLNKWKNESRIWMKMGPVLKFANFWVNVFISLFSISVNSNMFSSIDAAN